MAKGWTGVEKRTFESKDAALHPWVFRCPKPNCYYAIAADSEENAREKEASHDCPYQGGATHVGGSLTIMLVEDMWAKADTAYAAFLEEGVTPDVAKQRGGIVRGMCEMIALFMAPYFTTGDDVGKELRKRRAGGSDYETPGLYGRKYEPPKLKGMVDVGRFTEGDRVTHKMTGQSGTILRISEQDGIVVQYDDQKAYGANYSVNDLTPYREPKAESERVKALSDDEKNTIRRAKKEMGFTEEQIASTFNLTPTDVKTVLGS